MMQVDDGREFKVSRGLGKAGVATGWGVLCGLAGSPGMVMAYVEVGYGVGHKALIPRLTFRMAVRHRQALLPCGMLTACRGTKAKGTEEV